MLRLHDDLWLHGKPSDCAHAWKTIESFVEVFGLGINTSKTGSLYVSDSEIEAFQKAIATTESVGQQRMRDLHRGSREALEVSPNLWAGIGLVRTGAGTALVGDPASIAARLQEYADIGIDTVIGSGYPHLEEAFRVAELLFPRLNLAHRQPQLAGGFAPPGQGA